MHRVVVEGPWGVFVLWWHLFGLHPIFCCSNRRLLLFRRFFKTWKVKFNPVNFRKCGFICVCLHVVRCIEGTFVVALCWFQGSCCVIVLNDAADCVYGTCVCVCRRGKVYHLSFVLRLLSIEDALLSWPQVYIVYNCMLFFYFKKVHAKN